MPTRLGNPCVRNELATMIKGPIDIGIGSVIGAHCLILPNVTIGDGASIGAGCVVNFHVPKGGMVRAEQSHLLNKKRDVDRIKEMALRIYDERGC